MSQSECIPAFPSHSFWSEDYGHYRPTDQLTGGKQCDVAIIGGGFTGLSCAINLKLIDPNIDVILIEQEAIGYGASGRNSGWVWPNVTGYESILRSQGIDKLKETYKYAKTAYEYVKDLVHTYNLDSEYRETGLLRPSISKEYEIDRIKYEELCEKMGRGDQISFVSSTELAESYNSPLFYHALWDNELALIHPVKHARSLANLARDLGVKIYENTPALDIRESSNRVHVGLPSGSIKTDRLVIATNAYTHLLRTSGRPFMNRYQRPAFVYNMVTRQLSDDEWDLLGWKNRNAIYSFGPASHFGNPTHDGRLHWCSDKLVGVPHGNDMSHCWEYHSDFNSTLKNQMTEFFPSMKGVELSHHWGGPVSITMNQFFQIGQVNKSSRVFMSIGCNGNGVSTTHLNGKIVAELVTQRKTELSDFWFLNEPCRKWPTNWIATSGIRTLLAFNRWSSKRKAESIGFGALVRNSEYFHEK